MTDPESAAIAAFYDEWTHEFLAGCDDVFQSGLPLPPDGPESVDSSARFLATEARIARGHRVLDIGCGVGGPARLIAAAIPGVEFDGVTISPVQVAEGRRLTRRAGLADRVRLHLADFHDVPFPDASFDRVVAFEVTGYSHDLGLLYREIARVLTPGGLVYVKDVFRSEGPLDEGQATDLEAFDRTWRVVRSPTISETVAAMEAAGFVDVEWGRYVRVGTDRFIGAMFRIEEDSIELSPLGRGFLRRFDGLPVDFGWVRGTTGPDAPDSSGA